MDKIMDKSSVVADTIHGQIAISLFEKDIIATTLFNRLHGIHQNSTAYMTFPTNRTKRVEHSFGTMYLCGNMFSSSVCNASDEDRQFFFQTAQEKIREIIKSVQGNEGYTHKLGNFMQKAEKNYQKLGIKGGIYDRITPGNLEAGQQKIFIILFEAVRISGLLHDVGHPPFSHITEFALKNVYARIKNENIKNETVNEFQRIMVDFCQNGEELHEQMGNSIAEILLKDAIEDIDEKKAKDDAVYNKQLFRLIVSEMALGILREKDTFYADLHSIISGTLDGDRLDYVSRDALNSGFDVGIIEYERLISSMKMVVVGEKGRERFAFCPSTSVINTIEDFLIRRWNLYCNIIYHHHVVKTDYLLQKCIEETAYVYLKEDKDKIVSKDGGKKSVLEEEDSDCSYILPYNISGLWKAIQYQASPLEWGYSINQWDDAWLMTVLKKLFFEKIIDETTCLNKMLTELLTNKRRFISLIKRKEEFGVIDRAVAHVISKHEREVTDAIIRLQSRKKMKGEMSGVDIARFLKSIKELFSKSRNYSQKGNLTNNDGFLLVFIHNILSFEAGRDRLQEIVSASLEMMYGEQCLVVFKSPKTGTKKDLHIYKKYHEPSENALVQLNEVSDISKMLENNRNFHPFFYIYLDMELVEDKRFDFPAEREKIGTVIAEKICEYIIDFFNKI